MKQIRFIQMRRAYRLRGAIHPMALLMIENDLRNQEAGEKPLWGPVQGTGIQAIEYPLYAYSHEGD